MTSNSEKQKLLDNIEDDDYGTSKKSSLKKTQKEKTDGKTSVSLGTLFRYATKLDALMLVVGTFVAVITGGGYPFMSIIFGGLSNTFISAQAAIDSSNSKFYEKGAYSQATSGEANDSLPLINYETFTAETIKYCLDYTYLGLTVMIAGYVQMVCWLTTCERLIYRLRKEFFYAILRQEVSWFDLNASGTLTTKLSDNLERVKEGIGDKLGMLVQYVAQFLAGFIIAFVYSWQMTLVMLAVVPLLAGAGAFMSRLIGEATVQEAKKYSFAGSIAEEVIGNIRTVISFNGQEQESIRYENALADGRKDGVKKGIYTGLGLGFTFFVMFCSYGLAFWYGSVLIVDGSIERGTVFTVLFSVMMGSFAIGTAGPQVATLASAMGAAASIFEIIDNKPTIDSYSTEGTRIQNPKGEIEFDNVKFSYPTRKETPVLRGITFKVKPGEKIALVGSSGCGKSTIVSLLLRYYDPDAGSVRIDACDVASLNIKHLRRIVGVVSQEATLFDTSVEENIRMGRANVSKSQLLNACQAANAHEFISMLPDGYNTLVGERGVQLSGGQKQRIAIARALVRDPKILLLDEATSALDAESEGVVQEALDKAQKGRTTIVIAHRLSTIRNADKIIAIEKGEIKEIGHHSDLMNAKGLYYNLVTAQLFGDAGYQTATEEEAEIDKDKDSEDGDVKLSQQPRRISKSRRSRVQSRGTQSKQSHNSFESASESSKSVKERLIFMKKKENEIERLRKELQSEGAKTSDLKEIFRYAKPELCMIIFGILVSCVRAIIMPAFSFFYVQIFNAFSMNGQDLINQSIIWALGFVLLGLIQGLTMVVTAYTFGVVGENLTMRLRLSCFKNVLRQDVAYFDNPLHNTGKICTRLATDAPNIKAAVDFRLANVIQSLLSLLFGFLLAFFYGWKMTLVVIVILPLVVAGQSIRMRFRERGANRDAQLLEEAGKLASEAIDSVRTVQALTKEQQFYRQFVFYLSLPYKEGMKQAHIQALTYAFAQSIFFFMYAISFRFGAYLVQVKDMQPTDVYQVFFAISFSSMAIGFASTYLPEYMKARFSAGLIFKMISQTPKIDSMSKSGVKPVVGGSVTFDDVTFRYPSRPEAPVLEGLSFAVEPGNTLALVGASGCGKSTTVSLLQRYYDPLTGRVKIDDYDTSTLNIEYLRSIMSIVSQEPTLFDCSIEDNITYGMKEVTHEKVRLACRQANIDEFITSLPMGYATRVGERGTQLSGGQKQRIAIARALVRNPKILLLDEATSALDTESEKVVQEALEKARAGRTCIIIAHRLSTVKSADQIAVIKQGRIIELGTHQELVSNAGFYYKLTKKQNISL